MLQTLPLARVAETLWSLEVEIKGETRTFFFDTGAGITCLSLQEAKRAGITPYGRITGFRMSGERIDMKRCDDITLEIGGSAIRHETVGVFDLMALIPSEWDPVAGVIALNTFANQPISFNLAEGWVRIESPESLLETTADFHQLRVKVARPCQGIALDLFIGVDTPKGTAWFEMDTGNIGPTIVSPHTAEMLGWEIDTGIGENKLSVERQTLALVGETPLETDVVVKDIIYDGCFGTRFLQGRTITLDLQNEQVWIKSRT